MAIALVGSAGAVVSGTASASPAPGQSSTAGNILIAGIVAKGGSAGTISTTSTGWVQAVQNAATQWAAIFYKPNCGAGEATPVFTSASATAMRAGTVEFSGVAISSPVDKTGSTAAGSATTPAVIVTSGADTGSSNLVISVASLNLTGSATSTFTETWTPASGTAGVVGTDGGTASAYHINIAYYLLGGHGGGAADQNSEAVSGGTISGINWAIASFIPAATANAPRNTIVNQAALSRASVW